MKTKKTSARTNGKGTLADLLTHNQKEMVVNEAMSRAQFFKSILDTTKRDLNAECKYPDTIQLEQYQQMYDREPYGKRVCRLWSSECWKMFPEIYEVEDVEETEFEKAWKKLQVRCQIYHFLKLIDELSGIGHYGVLFMGFDDGESLDQPVRTINQRGERVEGEQPVNLMYLRCFTESLAKIIDYETEPTNPRYGQPTLYEITFDNTETQEILGKQVPADRNLQVHWSRVVHIAPNCTTSIVFGTPYQEAVFNRLLDIRKVLGGSAEMFWKGAFPGWSFETHPDALNNNADLDIESIKQQVERWESGLQRYFASLGLTVKSLAPQVEDPTQHIDVQIQAITTVMEVPKRVFLGSEIGELASTQDKATWNDRVHAKQEDHTTPIVVRPVITRLILVGALPYVDPDEFKVHWPDLNAPSGKDKADVLVKLTDAFYKYRVGGVHEMIPLKEYLEHMGNFDIAVVKAVVEAAMASAEDENDEDPLAIVDDEKEQQQIEAENRQFQKQKELTQVKQKKAASTRQPRQTRQPVNNQADDVAEILNAGRKKKRKVKRKKRVPAHSY